MPEAYRNALEQTEISPFAEPKLQIPSELKEDEPFSFTAIIPTAPKVRLGQYQGLEVEQHEVRVTDEDVEGYLERLRQGRNALREVDRPVQEQDFVTLEITDVGSDEEPRMLRVVAGGSDSPLESGVVGKSKGEEFQVPADEEAGLPARKATVREVRAFVVPDLDDEFAASVSEFSTLEELRRHVREQLEGQAREIAESDVRERLIEAIKRTTEVSFPQELVEAEAADRLSRFINALNESRTTLDMYLRRQEKTLAQFEREVADATRESITKQLILEEIAEREGLMPEHQHAHGHGEAEASAGETEADQPAEAAPAEQPAEDAAAERSWLDKTWDFLKQHNRIVTVTPEKTTEAA